MTEIRKKTLEELEAEYGEVMNNPVISSVTKYAPANTGVPFDEVAVLKNAEKHAGEWRDVMDRIWD